MTGPDLNAIRQRLDAERRGEHADGMSDLMRHAPADLRPLLAHVARKDTRIRALTEAILAADNALANAEAEATHGGTASADYIDRRVSEARVALSAGQGSDI